jgi:PAS domain S-box-containing protein
MDVPDLVFVYSEDGRYLFANKAAGAFLGADPFDIIGQHWKDLGYADNVMEPLLEAVREVFDTGKPDFYHTVSSPERGARSLDISLTPLRCEGGESIGALAICRDVTNYMSCL